ncbi:serine/threonine-protein kinase [Sphaerisporangium corydalis]|uniref:non-specific serine/threonine protein kinase n=1 Tax=Sphaerisporangium corydalis TaxID=1441875 RepID=A0ABV9ENT2_9ACTN|nr:serine/threonine-protein kinase [Sphaerisporangium corydalis]
MGTPGQLVVKRYRLVRALGQGGMGMVWEGHDTLLDRVVAVKEVLVPHRLDSRQQLQMIHRTSREARTAARLNHRNIVGVFDVAEEDGRPWIIMELVPSRSLDRVIGSEGTLSVPRAATIAREVLTALSIAHTAGVVHRDVKPANILIGYDGRVVLSDFGIATSLGDPSAQRSGTVGSPGFVAPERAGGAPAAPEGDVWSLGATLFAMVAGRPPFDSSMGPLASLLTQDAEVAKAPAELRPVLAGLLAKDPAKRMGAAEARRLLDDVLSPEDAAAPSGRAGGGSRSKLLAGVVAAAVVVAGTIGGWAVLRPDGIASAGRAGAPPTGAPVPGVPSPGATPFATPAPVPSRLKLKWHDAGQGWKAAVPRGWQLSIRQNYFTWSDRTGTAYMGVEFFDAQGRVPIELMRATEDSLSSSVRKYRKIRLVKLPATREGVSKNDGMVEWESTWTGPGYHSWAVKGVPYHELQRMIVTGNRISVIDWVTTKTEWDRLKPTLDSILRLYHPPSQ